MDAVARRSLLVAFVVATLGLVFFGRNAIASEMMGRATMGADELQDLTSRIVPSVLVLGVAGVLGWALFGKRH